MLVFVATLVAYIPAFSGGMVWDDDHHVTPPELWSIHGLQRIWFDLGATQQYYPLLHSAFWIEHRLWGDATLGYHLVNVLLHASTACLLGLILRRLLQEGGARQNAVAAAVGRSPAGGGVDFPRPLPSIFCLGAGWFAALLFALHPVCVESVAWISEQKNVLSGVFYMGAALVYLDFDERRTRVSYAAATILFVMALLSKTTTATLPAALLVVCWWRRGRLGWRDIRPLVPWLAIGAAGGVFTAWVERTMIGAEGPEFVMTFLGRGLLAGRALWFYMGKLVWPADLMFIYPRWAVDPAAGWQYLFPIAFLVLAAGLGFACFRSRPTPEPVAATALAGLLFFAGTLFPALGFLNVYPFIYSFVADHFQYLAGLGIIVPLALGLLLTCNRVPVAGRWAVRIVGVALPATLGALTWQQCHVYRDAETVYRDTIARNPGCWMAHFNLGVTLANDPAHLPEAVAELEATLRIRPDYAEAHADLGNALVLIPGRLPDAVAEYEAALRLRPGSSEIHNNLGNALVRIPGRVSEAIAEFEAALRITPGYPVARVNLGNVLADIPGRLPEAIAEYREALRIDPGIAEAHNNLGRALAANPGRLPEAIREFRAALRISPDYTNAHINLGNALADVPDGLPEAVAEYEAALRISPDSVDAHYNLGIALQGIPGRRGDALAHFEEALRLKPDFEPARQMIIQLAPAQR